MQKSMRYHIADGENQPVVRAVALVVQARAGGDPSSTAERARQQQRRDKIPAPQGKSRWLRPALRKAHLASS